MDPALLTRLMAKLTATEFHPQRYVTGNGQEFWEELKSSDTECVAHAFNLIFNRAALFDAIRLITGCEAVRGFSGRIYRMVPGDGHHSSWHDDFGVGKLIGLSLNLSPDLYSGGLFQLRRRGSEQLLAEIANTGLGDAHVFRISRELQHQVTPVEGRHPKTACIKMPMRIFRP